MHRDFDEMDDGPPRFGMMRRIVASSTIFRSRKLLLALYSKLPSHIQGNIFPQTAGFLSHALFLAAHSFSCCDLGLAVCLAMACFFVV